MKKLYKMATNITTISLPLDQMRYVDENNIKLSKLVQENIRKLMEESKINGEFVRGLQERIDMMKQTIHLQMEFIAERKLLPEFSEFKNKNVKII